MEPAHGSTKRKNPSTLRPRVLKVIENKTKKLLLKNLPHILIIINGKNINFSRGKTRNRVPLLWPIHAMRTPNNTNTPNFSKNNNLLRHYDFIPESSVNIKSINRARVPAILLIVIYYNRKEQKVSTAKGITY